MNIRAKEMRELWFYSLSSEPDAEGVWLREPVPKAPVLGFPTP
jgi:hypothetical protein